MTPNEKLAKIKDLVEKETFSLGGIEYVLILKKDLLNILNEPEVNPGDRFPHITHHEEHQHDDSDGW